MMYRNIFIFTVLALLSSTRFCAAETQSWHAVFDSAGTCFAQGNYSRSIEMYEALLAGGHASPAVYFNLGNAYFKVGQTGRSILAFERALRYDPTAKDARENLSIARERVRDNFQPLPVIFLVRWWNDIQASSTPMRLTLWMVLFLWLAGAAAFGLFGMNSVVIRRISLVVLATGVGCFLLSTMLYMDKVDGLKARKEAIILAPETDVRGAPDASSDRLLLIHEGSKVRLEETQGTWVRIRLIDGRTGWIAENDVERI